MRSPDGSRLDVLPADIYVEYQAWSTEGAKIAFMFHSLYVMNADGSDQRRITDKFVQFVDWSPDGRYLVFAPGLNIIRPDGSGLTSLHVGVGEPEFPDWIGTAD